MAKQTTKQIVAEIESRIPEIKAELLRRVEQDRKSKGIYPRLIDSLFCDQFYGSEKYPVGWDPRLGQMIQETSSAEYLFSIIREYQHLGLAYAGQIGIDGIGHSDNWDNGGYSRKMFFKRTPYWKATYLWYQLDTNIDTIYMALIKIGNKWFQLNLSAQGSKADEIYWKEGFRSKFFEV